MTQGPSGIAEQDGPLVRDVQRYLDSTTKSRLPVAQARYQYSGETDKNDDHIRTGLIVLNSATLLVVFTALGTDIVAGAKFGTKISDFAFSACCFILVTVLAAIAVMVESWRLPVEAATQFDRASRLENLQGTLNNTLSVENLDSCRRCMDEVHALPSADFTYSPVANTLTNLAGAAWIGGMILPLWRIASLIHWFGL